MDLGSISGPPAASAVSCSVIRDHRNVCVNELLMTSRPQDRGRADNLEHCINYKDNQYMKPNMENMGQKMPLKISQDLSECNNAWMFYLQGLAGLCSAGARVSHSLQVLAQGLPVGTTAGHCRSAWDELMRATQTASLSVRGEVSAGLRELATEEQPSRTTEQIVSSSLATLINLQYQFCVACCECLGNIGAQEVVPPQQQQHHQQQPLHQHHHPQQQQQQQMSPSGESAGSRQQQLFSRLLGGQRRWSEVAARRTVEREEDGEEGGAPRRWSVPWEGPGAGGGAGGQHQLAVPLVAHERSSRSTTPDSASLASQEELQEVISLLSCRPVTQLHPTSRQLPGVTLTNCSQPESRDVWPQVVPVFPRDTNTGGWSQGLNETTSHGESGPRRGGSPRPTHHHRTRAGWTPHEPLYNTIWGEQEGEQAANLELFPPNQSDGCSPYQRKSSSSTDSSSSSSLPQQHTNSVQDQRPSHLYSMWNSSEVAPVLPFIQLPSSPGHSHQDNPGNMLP